MEPPRRFPWFEDFLGGVAAITARLLGADRVDLRTYSRLPPSEQEVSGAAYIGFGRMDVGHDVPEFIEYLLRAHRTLSAAELERLRKVLGTLLHESIHLALPGDYQIGAGALGRTAPSGVFLEEGVTELTTRALLPHLLTQLESVFPGISGQVPDRSRIYPNYLPATRELLSVVAGLPETRGRGALLELAREGPERKMDLLVEQAMAGFGLTFYVPARNRDEVRSRIRSALEAQVQGNHRWMVPPDRTKPRFLNTGEPEALSVIMGKQMGFELLRQLYAEGERAGMELPDEWREILAEREVRTARKLLGRSKFTRPEAYQVIQSWIAAAAQTHKPRSPTISPGEAWLRKAKGHRPRASWARYANVGRGMTR